MVVTVPARSRSAFRYLADRGQFFDDPDADLYEDNGYGGTHVVVTVDATTNGAAARRGHPTPTPVTSGPRAGRSGPRG